VKRAALAAPCRPALHLLVVTGALHLTVAAGWGTAAGSDPVAGGGLAAGTVELGPGDAVRSTDTGLIAVTTERGAELLAWRMRSGLSVG